jgi:hypothetical protein
MAYWNRMTKQELEEELDRINGDIATASFANDFENWDDLVWAQGEIVNRLRGGNYARPPAGDAAVLGPNSSV